MADDIVEVMETVHDGKSYVIAQSLKEQKRSNDLKEIELKQSREWYVFIYSSCFLIFSFVIWLLLWIHANNITTRILT